MHIRFVAACRRAVHRTLFRLRHEEDGFVTALSLILILGVLIIGGIAVDGAHVTAQRTMLQGTSDSSAHAALMARQKDTEAVALERAVTISQANMPTARYGNVITDAQIEFGDWDPASRVFTPVPGATNAVRVIAQRSEAAGNAVPNFLLRFVGRRSFDVATVTVYATRKNPCFFNGIIARNGVDFTSNNVFRRDFCIHSNDLVRLRQNNVFEPGAILSLPSLSLLDMPNSGLSGNPGLADALREGRMNLGFIDELPQIIDGLVTNSAEHIPIYIEDNFPVQIPAGSVDADSFVRGRIHEVICSRHNQALTLVDSMMLEEVVIVTNCDIRLGNGARILDSIVATTSTSSSSISGVSGSGVEASIGQACAPGPGAQFLTLGGMRFAAKLTVNGGQFAAVGDVAFTSQAVVEGSGVSIVSGNEVGWTANADMSVSYCDAEFDNHQIETRLRMVQ